jgi:hypothetical protein
MSTPEHPYHVFQRTGVNDRIQAHLARAASPDVRAKALSFLEDIVARLRTDPLEWGDPEYNTIKQGGVVCHGIAGPFFVHFVVFEDEESSAS